MKDQWMELLDRLNRDSMTRDSKKAAMDGMWEMALYLGEPAYPVEPMEELVRNRLAATRTAARLAKEDLGRLLELSELAGCPKRVELARLTWGELDQMASRLKELWYTMNDYERRPE